jgi:hypothetical protein
VQNSCSLISGPEEGEFVKVPYSEKIVPYEELGAKIAMLSKGNVLQYKKNSSNLTKQQRYSLIAKGQWTNRTKTWATQSDRGYTNPNNQSYIRVGTTNVTLDGVPTFLPVTCPRFPIINNGVLPAIAGGGTQNNVLPPPVPPAPNAGGSVIPLVPVSPVEPIVIQDFGNLVCGTFENLCTGEIIRPILLDNCHPTTDSDVPGPIEELCWNDGNPTWYPRQRYVMSNSTDKWPVNAQLGNAVIFDAPILSATVDCNVVTLSWPLDIFYTSYNIYQDGLIIATVNGFTNTFTVTINNPGIDSFYIKGVNGNVESKESNTVSITINPPPAPTNLNINTVCNVATLTWDENFDCFVTYQVYQNDVLIATTTNTSLSNITFNSVGIYDFYVVALFGAIASAPSNTVFTTIVQPPPPVLLPITTVCDDATLNWTNSSPCSLTYQVYANNSLIATTTNTTYNYTLQDNVSYTFYVVAFLGSIASANSNTETATFQEFTTNGLQSTTNPLSNDTTVTGYTYILFNNSSINNYYFNSCLDNLQLYYMIVGHGSNGQSGSFTNLGSIGGQGGGAGGIWNGLTSLSSGNYSITIPPANGSPTIIENSLDPNIFNITAESGIFRDRGAVNKTVNTVTSTLSPSSNVYTEFGVGGKPSSEGANTYNGTIGGPVYTTGMSNYITFMGDGLVSNTLFGGGGGGGGAGQDNDSNNGGTNGYNGGGGGGGSGQISGAFPGGTGLNGNHGGPGNSLDCGSGGNAYTIPQGYGAGGGGGGSNGYDGDSLGGIGCPGGTGGPAMLMIYFNT